MAEIRSFTGFKDWMLAILLGGIMAMQVSINTTVNRLATNDAVRTAMQDQLEKRQLKIEIDVADLRRDQQKNNESIVRIQEYIKPEEIREQRKTVIR